MPTSVNTVENAFGVINHSTGNITTTAATAAAVVLSLGFVPRVVRIQNITDRIMYEWYSGMTNPGAIKSAAAGTRTLETTEGPTFGTAAAGTQDQVSIPASIMIASKVFVWEAFG